nr:glycosyltransferase [uncultured Capnocytophaga sp.]
MNFRKKTEMFGRREGEFLVKKGCKEGGGSL